MLKHQQADTLYNQYSDFEAALSDVVAIIGDRSANPHSDGNPTLFLLSQHLDILNRDLYQLLCELTEGTAETAGAKCGVAASALPSAAINA